VPQQKSPVFHHSRKVAVRRTQPLRHPRLGPLLQPHFAHSPDQLVGLLQGLPHVAQSPDQLVGLLLGLPHVAQSLEQLVGLLQQDVPHWKLRKLLQLLYLAP